MTIVVYLCSFEMSLFSSPEAARLGGLVLLPGDRRDVNVVGAGLSLFSPEVFMLKKLPINGFNI